MRILLLATAATVLSGCSFHDQYGTYGVSHTVSPYATTGIYAGCTNSTYNNSSYNGCSTQSYDPCAVTYTPANHCQSQTYPQQAYANQGYQSQNYDQYATQDYGYPQQDVNTQNYYQGHTSHCVQPCTTTGYYTPQTTSTYPVSYATPAYYGSEYYALRGGHHQHGYNNARRGYVYGEIGAQAEFGIENVDPIFDGIARLGYQSANVLGAEIEGSIGIVGDDILFDAGAGPEAADYKLKQSLGAFAVARAPLGQVDGFIRGGYHETEHEVELESDGSITSIKDRGFAVGGGLEVPVSANGYLRGDVTYYENGAGADEDMWATSLTYQHRF